MMVGVMKGPFLCEGMVEEGLPPPSLHVIFFVYGLSRYVLCCST